MQEKKANKGLKALGLLLLAVALVAGGYFLAQRQARSGPVTNNDLTQSFEFEEGQTQQVQQAQQSAGITIPGYSIVPVKANSTEVEMELYNPDENNVYFQISLILKDSGEQLYQSKLIQPGQHLYKIQLAHGLEPGEHNMTVQYSTFSMDDSFTPKNGASVDCIVRAE